MFNSHTEEVKRVGCYFFCLPGAANEGDPDGDPAGAAGEILRAQDVEAHYQDGESACRTDPVLQRECFV